MKVNIGADTSDFEKGAKEVKKGLKDLSKTGEDALGASAPRSVSIPGRSAR